MKTVLVVDRGGGLYNLLRLAMSPKGYRLARSASIDGAIGILEGVRFGLIFADLSISGLDQAREGISNLCSAGGERAVVAMISGDPRQLDDLREKGLRRVIPATENWNDVAGLLEAILESSAQAGKGEGEAGGPQDADLLAQEGPAFS